MISTTDRILLTVWKILSISPVSCRLVDGGSRIEAKFSRVLLAYGIFAVCVLVPACILVLLNDINDLVEAELHTTTFSVVIFCDVSSIMLAGVAAVLGSMFNCKLVIAAQNSLLRADERLRVANVDSGRPAVLIVSGFLLITVFSTLDYFVWTDFKLLPVIFLPFYTCNVIALGTEFQYYNLVVKLNARFRALNNKIVDNLRMVTKQETRVIMPSVETINHGPDVGWFKEDDILIKIGEANDIHWLLCGIIKELNTAFGVQLLFILFYIFIHLIINPYFFVLCLTYPNIFGTRNNLLLALQVIWTFFHTTELFLLISPCSSTTDEANRTTTLISKYLNRRLSSNTRRELQMFIVQLLHHEADFSACGMFNLNLKRITAVTGAITTYLVILIQFQNADT